MKRLLALLLAAILTLSCCSVVLAEEAAAQDVVTVELALAAKVDHGDWNDFWCLDLIEKECGIRFHVTQYSEDAWAEKKGTMFALDTYPEVFLNDLNDIDLANYGTQGYLLPLEDYITPENMPNVFKVMEEGYPDILKGMTFPDGHIYSFRGVNGSTREYALSRYFVNVSWAEKLNVKVPENLEEFYTYLCAVRDGDPNGNGDTTDEFPISGRYGKDSYTDHFIPILVAFGFLDRRVQANDDGAVMYVPVQENYKEFLKYMNRLWSENLINKESFTQDYTMFQANAQNPEIPLVGVTNGYSIANRVGTQWASQHVVCGPFALGDGTTPYYLTANNVGVNKGSIFTNCKDIEAAVRVLDACYDEKISVQMMLGSIGDTMTYEDGHYTMTTPTDGSDADRWKWINSIADNGPFYISRETQSRIDLLPDYLDRLEQSDFYKPYFRDSKVALYPAMAKMTADDANELALLNADIYNYVSNRFATWVTTGGVDEEWNDYLAQLDAMQIDRVREIYQNTYDNYMANAE